MSHGQSYLVAVGIFAATIVFSLFGWTFGWYGRVGWYDEVSHAAVSLGVAVVIAVLLDRRLAGAPAGVVLRAALVTCVTLTIGLAWELLEWSYDMQVAGNAILGKRDTMIDFLCDALGAVLGAALGLVLARSSSGRW